ncbi:hypothetical protein C8R45DRAFT_935975 [Mycena sanguinolenta]|nr:hypothetical protein C8R45DRAFT_935975 [Mycena sanguinolenta]
MKRYRSEVEAAGGTDDGSSHTVLHHMVRLARVNVREANSDVNHTTGDATRTNVAPPLGQWEEIEKRIHELVTARFEALDNHVDRRMEAKLMAGPDEPGSRANSATRCPSSGPEIEFKFFAISDTGELLIRQTRVANTGSKAQKRKWNTPASSAAPERGFAASLLAANTLVPRFFYPLRLFVAQRGAEQTGTREATASNACSNRSASGIEHQASSIVHRASQNRMDARATFVRVAAQRRGKRREQRRQSTLERGEKTGREGTRDKRKDAQLILTPELRKLALEVARHEGLDAPSILLLREDERGRGPAVGLRRGLDIKVPVYQQGLLLRIVPNTPEDSGGGGGGGGGGGVRVDLLRRHADGLELRRDPVGHLEDARAEGGVAGDRRDGDGFGEPRDERGRGGVDPVGSIYEKNGSGTGSLPSSAN